LTPEAFARSFDEGTGHDELLDAVLRAPDAGELISGLATSANTEVRAWLAHALPELSTTSSAIRKVAASTLRGMSQRDTDSDIRDEAMNSLLSVDPKAAATMIPILRRRMTSSDYHAPVSAMWALAKLGAKDALKDVRGYAERMGDDRWQGRQARIVALVLAEDDESLARQLEHHDHDMTHALCRAALLRPTESLRQALETCAREFDSDCSGRCRDALASIGEESA
jgi:hypothetical protein